MKAKLYQQLESPTIVDVSHFIDPFHIGQAAYVLRSVYRDFPEGSIHFIGVDFNQTPEQEPIVASLNGHYFVCTNNGFLSLLESGVQPSECVIINTPQSTIIDKGMDAIAHLHRGGALSIIGSSISSLKQLSQHTPFINDQKDEIQGHVLHIDRFGNVVTTITQKIFDQVGQKRPFIIHARNHRFKTIFQNYHEVVRFDIPKERREEAGKKLALFNQQGHLELAIYKGNPTYGGGANTLFGLSFLDPVRIAFISEG